MLKGPGFDYSRAGQPDARRAREVLRRARRGKARRRVRQRLRGDDGDPPHAEERRPRPRRRRRLRRHLPHLRQGDEAVRRRGDVPRHERPGEGPRGRPAQRRGSCGWRRRRTRCSRSSTSRRSPRWREKAGAWLAVDNTFATPMLQRPARARRGHRRPLDDEVHERPLRRRRRRGRDERRCARRAPPLHPEVRRRQCRARSIATWCFAGSRRSACACGSTSRARGRWPSGSRRTRRSSACTTRASPTHSGSRAGPEADEGAWGDDQLRAQGGASRRHEPSLRRSASSFAPRASAASSRSQSSPPS